jgi:hypothetical protein
MDVSAPSGVVPPSLSNQKHRLLFMGLKRFVDNTPEHLSSAELDRSGKSSIINVVLYKLPPTETVFIPTTFVIKKHILK